MTTLTTPEILDLAPVTAAAIDGEVALSDLPNFFDQSFGTLVSTLATAGVKITGAPFGYYPVMPGETATLAVGFPTDVLIAAVDPVHSLELTGGRIARGEHHGSYDTLGESWGALMAWVTSQGEAPRGDFWEVYTTEPGPDKDPATYVTELYLPLAAS